MRVSLLVFLIIIPLIFCIPVLLGVYVYRDANKRGMNAVLWTLIAILTPSLLGLIIYLLVRNNHSDLTCPNCNSRVEESFVVCPNCRTKLKPTCETCGAMVQTTWKVCPHCGTDLPQYDCTVATPVKQKDNTIGKILIAILVIPIVLILLLLLLAIPLSASNFSSISSYGLSSVTTMTLSEFMEGRTEKDVLLYQEWCDEIASSSEQPYHVSVYEASRADNIHEYQCLIFIPGAGEMQDISYHSTQKGFFKKQEYLVFDIFCHPANGEQTLFIYNYEGTEELPDMFLINYNGEEYEIKPDRYMGEPFFPAESDFSKPSPY